MKHNPKLHIAQDTDGGGPMNWCAKGLSRSEGRVFQIKPS
jgi:hypothetical protein